MDDEALSTLMCEVETIINGQPITKVSDDPNDFEALTPNHLLLLRTGASFPPGLFNKTDYCVRRRWRQVQYRWLKEYLPTLQQCQRWHSSRRNHQMNDVVLIVDNNLPRNLWLLGRVVEVHKSSQDGRVRSVKVKTKSSVLERPKDKLVLLEGADFAEGQVSKVRQGEKER